MARYDTLQLAHVWAQQTEPSGASGGALRFSGATLYSYGEPIGHFVTGKGGRWAVLISSGHFSPTTTGHQNLARWAVEGSGLPVFMVPRPMGSATANLKALAEYAADKHAKVKRARNKDAALVRADDAFAAARDFAAFFGLPFTAQTVAAVAEAVETARKREARKAARLAAAQRRADAAGFAAWRRGETSYPPASYRADPQGGAYLRIRGEELETSQGARVPLDHAVKAFRFVKLMRERGESWARNGRMVRVGHFALDSISAQGDIRAGCHLIRWPEIAHAAAEAGVFDAAPSAEAAEATGHASA